MMQIGSKVIGRGRPALVVAEIGGNHGGDPALARRMVEAAAGCKADAVKFQAYRTAGFLSPLSPYYDELAAEELDYEDLARLLHLARRLGLAAGLTVFDRDGLELAGECQADFIKISSGDITHLELLAEAASAGRPLFVSTGASDESEVREALKHLEAASDNLLLMQCASLYPAPPDSAALGVMTRWLHEGLNAGYSDHVEGLEAALAAIALGAAAVEKHFTIDRRLPGGDNSMSIEAPEMRLLAARASRPPEEPRSPAINPLLLGDGQKKPHPLESPMRGLIRRAVVAAADLAAGKVLEASDLELKRPPAAAEDNLPPAARNDLPGRILKSPLKAGSPLTPAHLEKAADG